MVKLYDPPELAQEASRGDPPLEAWPGKPIGRSQLMAAAGDSRDWFRYGHRLQAAEMAWAEFIDARRRRRDFRAGFDWNQILILGDFGSGKTSLGIHLARHWFGLGHAVFSNASCLFGWHLEHEEMYTAMGFMPKNSVLLIDESSAHLASRVGHGVAISSFSEMNLKYEEAEGERPTGQNGSPQDSQTERAHALLGFLQAHEAAPPKFFRAADFAARWT